MNYIFVGEKRSDTAIRMGVTWRDGRLAAKTLFEALREIGLEPEQQHYVNIYRDDGSLDHETLGVLTDTKAQIVAMGRKAQGELTAAGVPFRALIHPAARGAIRMSPRYRAHVASVLQPDGAP